MTIRERKKEKRLTINCDGPNGNAFQLLKLASDLGRQMGWTDKMIKKCHTEMKSSDYEHLIHTFDKHFGWHVILEFENHPSSKQKR
jgi:hypothetical protein